MIRIALADDHAIVRAGLKQLFALSSDMVVVEEFTHGQEVLEGLRHVRVDVLVLDLAMPQGMGGIDLIEKVRSQWPGLPLLVLSMHNEGAIVARALRTGANGYVAKDSDPDVLLAGLRKVAGGGRFIDPAVVEATVFVPPVKEDVHTRLSEREAQVLEGVVAGKTLSDIANDLGLSPKTVSTHKARLMLKLEIATNADLIRYALKAGLSVA